MKKLIPVILAVFLYGCSCIGQIPTQYVYVDENCTATLPNYLDIVIVSDNCELDHMYQDPGAETLISVTTNVVIAVVDVSGNLSTVNFDVVLLDTIPPTIQLNPEWTGYSDKEVGDMYRTFYGWAQLNLYAMNQELIKWDTIWVGDTPIYVGDSALYQKTYVNVIPIPDTMRNEWWWKN